MGRAKSTWQLSLVMLEPCCFSSSSSVARARRASWMFRMYTPVHETDGSDLRRCPEDTVLSSQISSASTSGRSEHPASLHGQSDDYHFGYPPWQRPLLVPTARHGRSAVVHAPLGQGKARKEGGPSGPRPLRRNSGRVSCQEKNKSPPCNAASMDGQKGCPVGGNQAGDF